MLIDKIIDYATKNRTDQQKITKIQVGTEVFKQISAEFTAETHLDVNGMFALRYKDVDVLNAAPTLGAYAICVHYIIQIGVKTLESRT